MAKNNEYYGSAGLNRGTSMKYKKPLPEGVVFGEMNNKWLVRVRKKGIIVSIACFDKKEDADQYYTETYETN